MLVAVEGINGCGKTTILNQIGQLCNMNGFRTSIISSKPDEETLKKLKSFSTGSEFNLDVAKQIADVFNENMRRISNEIVLRDDITFTSRWTLANYVYTMYNCPEEFKEELDSYLLESYRNIIHPSFTIFINTSPEVAMKRIESRDDSKIKSRYENIESLTSIYNLYCDILENEEFFKHFSDKNAIVFENEKNRVGLDFQEEIYSYILRNYYILPSMLNYTRS